MASGFRVRGNDVVIPKAARTSALASRVYGMMVL